MFQKSKSPRASSGAALVEYGIVAGFIVVSSIGAVVATGTETRDVFCTATNALARATSGDASPACDTAQEDGGDDFASLPTLDEDERYVDAPMTMAADFESVTYANAITGEQMVMTTLSAAPGVPFWLDVEIASQDAYEPAREISACYVRKGISAPICSLAAAFSTVQVPADATAIGYMVSLQSDTRMPWSNEVSISVPATAEIPAQSWDITVSRQEAAPILNVSFDMPNPTLQKTDTDWTYVPFVPIEGLFDTPIWLTVGSNGQSIDIYRQACYTLEIGGDPQCGNRTSAGGQLATVQVPVGAKEIGFAVKAPAEQLGADWVHTLPVALRTGGTEISPVIDEQSVTVTRPNEPIVRDVSFDMPDPTLKQTDTGWTYVPFVALEGSYNVPIWLTVGDNGKAIDIFRQACYTLEVGGDPQCGSRTTKGGQLATVEVPLGAAEIGFAVNAPAEATGADWVQTLPVALRTAGTEIAPVIDEQSVTVTRPNEPVVMTVTYDMAAHVFPAEASGWQYVPFVPLDGDFNLPLTLTINKSGDLNGQYRQACYTLEIGGDPICGSATPKVSDSATVTVPVGAKEIGFRLTTNTAGAKWSTTIPVRLSYSGGLIKAQSVSLSRPAL